MFNGYKWACVCVCEWLSHLCVVKTPRRNVEKPQQFSKPNEIVCWSDFVSVECFWRGERAAKARGRNKTRWLWAKLSNGLTLNYSIYSSVFGSDESYRCSPHHPNITTHCLSELYYPATILLWSEFGEKALHTRILGVLSKSSYEHVGIWLAPRDLPHAMKQYEHNFRMLAKFLSAPQEV